MFNGFSNPPSSPPSSPPPKTRRFGSSGSPGDATSARAVQSERIIQDTSQQLPHPFHKATVLTKFLDASEIDMLCALTHSMRAEMVNSCNGMMPNSGDDATIPHNENDDDRKLRFLNYITRDLHQELARKILESNLCHSANNEHAPALAAKIGDVMQQSKCFTSNECKVEIRSFLQSKELIDNGIDVDKMIGELTNKALNKALSNNPGQAESNSDGSTSDAPEPMSDSDGNTSEEDGLANLNIGLWANT